MSKYTGRILISVLGAAVVTAICASGLLIAFSNAVNDAAYQRPTAPDERIVVIGVDDRAIEQLGPWPWDRDVFARAIEYMNADPDNRPAVIGLDVVFDATSDDPAADQALADAAAEGGNVVVGAFGVFGNEIVNSPDGSFYINDYAVVDYEEPYEALKQSATMGHVNTMLDSDGVLRHAIWEVEFPSGETVPAFYTALAQGYAKSTGTPYPQKPPTDARGRWYVLQQSLPGAYSDGISVVDLVNGTVSPQFFADKIVLIGPYATGLQDEYRTPISPAQSMYGVEWQANALGSLMAETGKSEFPTAQYVIIYLLTFLCFWSMYGRTVLSSTGFWISGSVIWGIVCVGMFFLGAVLHILYGLFAATIAYIISIVQNYLRERTEKRRISFTFQRYVAPEIVSELLRHDPKNLALGGRTVDVAVMFADIRGFTSLSSKLPATEVVELINKILTVSSESVLQNHGTLDKYIGDCTMAFWGAPLPQEDYIFNALKTALELQARLNGLSIELEKQYGIPMGCGVGVNCGSVVVGNIGSASRMDYTIIGDTVNTASRLEGRAKAGEVYVSRAVVEALKGRAEFEYLGNDFAIKGMPSDFEIYKAIALKGN